MECILNLLNHLNLLNLLNPLNFKSIILKNPVNPNNPVHPRPINHFHCELQKSFPDAVKFWHQYLRVGLLPGLKKGGLYVFVRVSYPAEDGKSFVYS